MITRLVQEPGLDPRPIRPGILLVGHAASGRHLSVGSAGHCSFLQVVYGMPCRYRLWCLFCRQARWWTSRHQYAMEGLPEIELSTLSMMSSRHVRWNNRPCCSPTNHETSIVPVLSPGQTKTEKPCQCRWTSIFQLPTQGWVPEPLPGKQHQCELSGWRTSWGHFEHRGQHSCNLRNLRLGVTEI